MKHSYYSPHHLPAPSDSLKLVVTIPAKNEEDFIIPTLEALVEQELRDEQRSANYEVLVLINHSHDSTLKRCKQFKKRFPDFPLHLLVTYSDSITNVGAARKLLMDVAASRLRKDEYLIAMSDADTCVSKNWIANLLDYTGTDIDLICGEIMTDTETMGGFARSLFNAKEQYLLYRSRLEALMIPEYHNPWPRHACNSGPNMSIKKGAYLKIGGMPTLECLEDMALYRLAVHTNLAITHALNIPVQTSSRLVSRVARGFGDELLFWSHLKDQNYIYAVEGLAKMYTRLKVFQRVRKAYETQDFSEVSLIAKALYLPEKTILKLFCSRPNYQSMNLSLFTILEKNKKWQNRYPNIHLTEANSQLQSYFNSSRCSSKISPTKQVHTLDAQS